MGSGKEGSQGRPVRHVRLHFSVSGLEKYSTWAVDFGGAEPHKPISTVPQGKVASFQVSGDG